MQLQFMLIDTNVSLSFSLVYKILLILLSGGNVETIRVLNYILTRIVA